MPFTSSKIKRNKSHFLLIHGTVQKSLLITHRCKQATSHDCKDRVSGLFRVKQWASNWPGGGAEVARSVGGAMEAAHQGSHGDGTLPPELHATATTMATLPQKHALRELQTLLLRKQPPPSSCSCASRSVSAWVLKRYHLVIIRVTHRSVKWISILNTSFLGDERRTTPS